MLTNTRVVASLKQPAKASVGAALRVSARMSGKGLGTALMYHGLAEQARPLGSELVRTVSVDGFARHVAHCAHNYLVVPASQLQAATADRRRGDRIPVSITFDDDHSSYVPLALPVLRRYGVAATFFLNGASLDEPHWFEWELLQAAWDHGLMDTVLEQLPRSVAAAREGARRPLKAISLALTGLERTERDRAYEIVRSAVAGRELPARMNADDVRALVDAGQEIGFHTRHHPHLTELSDAELGVAFVDGRADLEEIVGGPVTSMAYPFGDWDRRVADAAGKAGFKAIFTTSPVPVMPASDPRALGRVSVPGDELAPVSLMMTRTLTEPARRDGDAEARGLTRRQRMVLAIGLASPPSAGAAAGAMYVLGVI